MDGAVIRAVEDWTANITRQPIAVVATPEVEKLGWLAEQLVERFALCRVGVGLELGNALLGTRPSRRSREAERWLRDRCREVVTAPALLTEIDLLFHPALGDGATSRLDPLALFVQTSRLRPITVLWPGEFDGQTLSYAVPAHSHYRHWRRPEARIIRAQ